MFTILYDKWSKVIYQNVQISAQMFVRSCDAVRNCDRQSKSKVKKSLGACSRMLTTMLTTHAHEMSRCISVSRLLVLLLYSAIKNYTVLYWSSV